MEGKNSKDNSTKSMYSPRSPIYDSTLTFHQLSHLMHDCLIESENSLRDFDQSNYILQQQLLVVQSLQKELRSKRILEGFKRSQTYAHIQKAGFSQLRQFTPIILHENF